jgi:hypothetical protein
MRMDAELVTGPRLRDGEALRRERLVAPRSTEATPAQAGPEHERDRDDEVSPRFRATPGDLVQAMERHGRRAGYP